MHEQDTYLFLPDTYIVPVVHISINAKGTHRPEDHLGGLVPIEGRTGEVYRKVGIA